MQASQVNPNYHFDNNTYIVSLLNTGRGGVYKLFDGHAVIVVEGEKQSGALWIVQCDIKAAALPQSIGDIVQGSVGNPQGVITDIVIHIADQYFKGKNSEGKEIDIAKRYRQATGRKCWRVNAIDAQRMIEHITEQYQQLQAAKDREDPVENWPFRYQGAGSRRLHIFGGNNEGESCVTWAEKNLLVAGIDNRFKLQFLDYSSALPQVHAGGCSLQ